MKPWYLLMSPHFFHVYLHLRQWRPSENDATTLLFDIWLGCQRNLEDFLQTQQSTTLWFTTRQLSTVAYAVQCNKECTHVYIWETEQLLHKCRAQHRTASSSGQLSAVHLYLNEKWYSFEDRNVHILDSKPSMSNWINHFLNRGGGLEHHLSATYNAVLRSFPRQINPCSHLDPCDPNDSRAGWVGQRLRCDQPQGANDSTGS